MRRPAPIYANSFRRHWGWWLLVIGGVLLAGWLLWRHLAPVSLTTGEYPVNGTFVSQTDGSVDFPTIKETGAKFVYVHAAQGASYQDDRVTENMASAQGAGLAVGVEHALSFDTTPEAQLANLQKAVGNQWGTLPVVVSLSLYGDYESTPPNQTRVLTVLTAMKTGLQKNGRSMIVRTSSTLANKYGLKQHFNLWITDQQETQNRVLFFRRGNFPHNTALPLITFNGNSHDWRQQFGTTLVD
ncbi:GH25 family lysozyme [Schleiferilactobacillus perolens]|uniref:GH25 family lysozyme n=1 Tax=Schleiferilactobacillus perolens TaxID=100468 RepID=UPI002355F505|nr:GH25 family lysozyme [Schleiferilactobacillus perolens]MCI2171642.1 hypothetical protein [Schleiferilactobacillus perolens]